MTSDRKIFLFIFGTFLSIYLANCLSSNITHQDRAIFPPTTQKREFQFKSISFHQMLNGGEDFTPAGVERILLPIGRNDFVCTTLRMRTGENLCAKTLLDFPSIYKPYYFDNKSIPFAYEFSIPDSIYTESKRYASGLLREAGFIETDKAPLAVQIIYFYNITYIQRGELWTTSFSVRVRLEETESKRIAFECDRPLISYYPIESLLIQGISNYGTPGSLFSNLLSGFADYEGKNSIKFPSLKSGINYCLQDLTEKLATNSP